MSIDRERVSRPREADFAWSRDDLRAVTAFTSATAEVVLPYFELRCPADTRPRHALDAALAVARGEPRSRAQRVSAPAAHRAGREASSDVAFHAAMAAGDAAASAYLHPLADLAQVKHILRAPAHAIRVIELADSSDECSGLGFFAEHFASYATVQLCDVLRRYPRISAMSGDSNAMSSRSAERPDDSNERPGRTRANTNHINRLMHELDVRLRVQPTAPSSQPTAMSGQP
ncbi:putative immunity protein [Brevibacterium picturae]|uniref:putative immunity protein n=1 Tax=Brevibacterium picturae TaxID=260553 RepID=UPI0031F78276